MRGIDYEERGDGPVVCLAHAGVFSAWFDPLAFRDVSDPRFGTSGLNTMRGPGLGNWDFGLFREFRVTERWRVQFSAEAFHLGCLLVMLPAAVYATWAGWVGMALWLTLPASSAVAYDPSFTDATFKPVPGSRCRCW